MADGTQNWTCS